MGRVGFGAHDGDAHLGEQVPVGVEVAGCRVEELESCEVRRAAALTDDRRVEGSTELVGRNEVLALVASGLAVMPLWVIVSLFTLASGVAISSPPATTLALVEYPQIAGTASSLLGMVRFGFGGVAAPLVGVAGAASILPLGLVTVTAVVLARAAYLVLGRRRMTAGQPAPEPAFH